MIFFIRYNCMKTFVILNFTSYALRGNSIRYNKYSSAINKTINTEEVEKFCVQASNWWNKNGHLKPLHAMNPLRVSLVRDGLKRTGVVSSEVINGPLSLKGLQILDVGCGGGILTEALATLGASVTGLDPGQELIDIAYYHSSQNPIIKNNVTYICGTIEDICKQNIKYDAVVASEVAEHVDNLNQFLTCCIQLIKDNGSLFFTTINRTWLSYIFAIIAAERILGIVPKGIHQWDKFILPSEFQQILENNGCNIRLIHGMCYNPLTNKWSWTKDTSINYALHAIKS